MEPLGVRAPDDATWQQPREAAGDLDLEHAAFLAMGMGAFVVDQEGLVVSATQAALDLLGAPRARVIGSSLPERLRLANQENDPQGLVVALQEIGPTEGTTQLFGTLTGDLQDHWVRCQIAKMGGQPRWCILVSDAGGERQITDELEKRAIADLEWNRARAEFLANLSHQARAPLSGLIGATSLLLETSLDRHQLEYARTARSAGDALLELVTSLLDEANLDHHALRLDVVDFDLHAALEDLGETCAHLAHQKGLDFLIDIEPTISRSLRGDAGRLRKVLLTLVNNAIQYTSKGAVIVRAEPVIGLGKSQGVRVSVLDSGQGLSEQQVSELTRVLSGQLEPPPFKRGRKLHLAGRLVAAMNGQIRLESHEGAGTRVDIQLPFQPTRGRAAPEPRATRLDGLKVLIVDASPAWRAQLHRQLERRGAEPWEVDTGARAIAALEGAERNGQPFDVALLDAHLPGADGFEVASQIRLSDQFQSLPLILMTRTGQTRPVREIFLGVLPKPLRSQALFSALALARRSDVIPLETLTDRRVNAQFRVLLVEDDLTCQRIASLTLERAGFAYMIARSGTEALELLEHHVFHLVLMDCLLPELDGYDTTREIRKRQAAGRLPELPIVAMTAEALAGDREACLDAGMDDYLSKPVQPRALYVMIHKYLQPKPGTEAVAPPSVDMSQLEEAAGGDIDFIRELVELYLNDTEHHLVLLEAAHRGGLFAELKREAHGIKGASANVGAIRMKELAQSIERSVADGALEALSESVEAMRAELGRVRSFFELKLAA